MNLLGTFQPRLVAIPSVVLSNGPELALHRHNIENKKNMHKFHTLQCKNNKLLLSNHHLLWCNIYTLWGSSSSVCDGEHFVLKIHKLLFDFVFRNYASCNHPLLKIFRPGQPYRLSACHLSMQHNHGLTRTALYL